ncbi:MAG: ATP-binding cassette domain-containing protein [Marinosulfonomonas sp.]|nr:ATP-binding cassette domain-containing protein [Marinosulfonomonas sp.]
MQSREGESGPVCLAMLLAAYRSFPKLTNVKSACGFSGRNIAIENLYSVATEFGLIGSHQSGGIDDLKSQKLPVIIQTHRGNYLLLNDRKANGFTCHDPAKGKYVLSDKDLADCFSGQYLALEPGEAFAREANTKPQFSLAKKWIRPNISGIAYVLLAGLIMLLPAIAIPALNKIFFDEIILLKQNMWFKPMLAIMAATVVFGSGLMFLMQKTLTRTELKMIIEQSSAFTAHLLKLPYSFLLNNPAGDTVNRIRLNAEFASLLSRDFTKIILNLLAIVFYAFVMIKYSLPLTIAGVSIILLNLLAVSYFSAKRAQLNQALYQKQQETFSITSDLIGNIETIKSQGWENDGFSLWAGHLTQTINNDQRLGFYSRILTVLPEVLNQLNSVVVVVLGGMLVIKGDVTVGVFIALQSFISNFATPVKGTVEISKRYQENISNINNLTEVNDLGIDPFCDDTGRPGIDTITPFNARLAGHIQVRNLDFAYGKFDEPLLNAISLEIKQGEAVAFVGRSGSGKSTLLKVLAGLYAPTSGEILYDGKPMSAINRDVLRNSISVIDQDIFLVTGSVSDNIVLWNRAIDTEDMIDAAKAACVHDIISAREGGYQARVAPGGANFSGGQCQRIEIARGLVTDPAIIFLDEATSALDSKTEKQVMHNIRAKNCTILAIAHRLTTIRDFDRIVVLDKGKIIQQGTHDDLISQKDKLYYQLVNEA